MRALVLLLGCVLLLAAMQSSYVVVQARRERKVDAAPAVPATPKEATERMAERAGHRDHLKHDQHGHAGHGPHYYRCTIFKLFFQV